MKRFVLAAAILLGTASLHAQPRNNAHRGAARIGAHQTYTGKKKGLIILCQFPDSTFTGVTTATLKDETLQAAVRERYNRIVNEAGYSDNGFTGSVSDYFKAQSRGQLELTFDVVGPYRTSRRAKYYGEDVSKTEDCHVLEMVTEMLKQADADVNYADYDWDGDGEVDQVFILYSGYGQASRPDCPNTIWPAESELGAAAVTYDEVKINTYAYSNELAADGSIDGIGTICHEFAHCFGIPDMYDKQTNFGATYRKYGMSYWDLMDFGNYNPNNTSITPAGFTAHERMYAGWLTPIELTKDTVVTDMKALEDGGDAYIIYNDGNRNEYYLLENRQKVGWDAGLPGAGLLITHVDYKEDAWTGNDVNTTKVRCTVVRAGYPNYPWAVSDLTQIATDTYPQGTLNALTNETSPAATLNNANTDGSKFLNKSITDITQNEDGTISFRFTNNNTTAITAVTASEDSKDKQIYTLGGQLMGEDLSALPRGIYIIGGKKVVK